jgi:hypothetical protein
LLVAVFRAGMLWATGGMIHRGTKTRERIECTCIGFPFGVAK